MGIWGGTKQTGVCLSLALLFLCHLKERKIIAKHHKKLLEKSHGAVVDLLKNVVLRSSGYFSREQPPLSGTVLSPGGCHFQGSQSLSLLTRTLGSYTTEKSRAILSHFSKSSFASTVRAHLQERMQLFSVQSFREDVHSSCWLGSESPASGRLHECLGRV